jgi:hypothetical protein
MARGLEIRQINTYRTKSDTSEWVENTKVTKKYD